MPHRFNREHIQIARVLRKHETRAEKKLWYEYLRKLPIRVQRQVPIGEYIVDFYCYAAQLVIELDGNQHGMLKNAEKDMVRDEYMESEGLFVVRIPNSHVFMNFHGVCEMLENIIQERMVQLGKEPMKLTGED